MAMLDKANTSPIPIAILWDATTCLPPENKSVVCLIQKLRKLYCIGHTESKFLCVHRSDLEHRLLVELFVSQASLVTVDGSCSISVADIVLFHLQKFCTSHGPTATVVVITENGEILEKLGEFCRRVHVILMSCGTAEVGQGDCKAAHEWSNWQTFTSDLPDAQDALLGKKNEKGENSDCLRIENIPIQGNVGKSKMILQKLVSKQKGTVIRLTRKLAIIRFPTSKDAKRAKEKLERTEAFGKTLAVAFSELVGSDTWECAHTVKLTPEIPKNNHHWPLNSYVLKIQDIPTQVLVNSKRNGTTYHTARAEISLARKSSYRHETAPKTGLGIVDCAEKFDVVNLKSVSKTAKKPFCVFGDGTYTPQFGDSFVVPSGVQSVNVTPSSNSFRSERSHKSTQTGFSRKLIFSSEWNSDIGRSSGGGDTGFRSSGSGDTSGRSSGGGDTGGRSSGGGDAGGRSSGGGDTGGRSSGGGDTGGRSSGGGDTGGRSSGGGDTGGRSSGGGDTGGRSSGGGDTGGRSSGGGDTGGRSSGGGDTGGRSSGGGDTGGRSSGGGDTGFRSSGGGDTGGRSNWGGDTGGRSSEGRNTCGQSSEGGNTGGRSSEGGDTGGRSSEDKNGGAISKEGGNNGRRNGQGGDTGGRSSEIGNSAGPKGKNGDGRGSEGGNTDGRSSEGGNTGGTSSEGGNTGSRGSEGGNTGGRSSEGNNGGDRSSEGKNGGGWGSEGGNTGSRGSEGKNGGGRSSEGKNCGGGGSEGGNTGGRSSAGGNCGGRNYGCCRRSRSGMERKRTTERNLPERQANLNNSSKPERKYKISTEENSTQKTVSNRRLGQRSDKTNMSGSGITKCISNTNGKESSRSALLKQNTVTSISEKSKVKRTGEKKYTEKRNLKTAENLVIEKPKPLTEGSSLGFEAVQGIQIECDDTGAVIRHGELREQNFARPVNSQSNPSSSDNAPGHFHDSGINCSHENEAECVLTVGFNTRFLDGKGADETSLLGDSDSNAVVDDFFVCEKLQPESECFSAKTKRKKKKRKRRKSSTSAEREDSPKLTRPRAIKAKAPSPAKAENPSSGNQAVLPKHPPADSRSNNPRYDDGATAQDHSVAYQLSTKPLEGPLSSNGQHFGDPPSHPPQQPAARKLSSGSETVSPGLAATRGGTPQLHGQSRPASTAWHHKPPHGTPGYQHQRASFSHQHQFGGHPHTYANMPLPSCDETAQRNGNEGRAEHPGHPPHIGHPPNYTRGSPSQPAEGYQRGQWRHPSNLTPTKRYHNNRQIPSPSNVNRYSPQNSVRGMYCDYQHTGFDPPEQVFPKSVQFSCPYENYTGYPSECFRLYSPQMENTGYNYGYNPEAQSYYGYASYQDYDSPGYGSPLPWRYVSSQQTPYDKWGPHIFRKTPGASRPSSRASTCSSYGSQSGGAHTRKSPPTTKATTNQSEPASKLFQPVRNQSPQSVLSASDLCSEGMGSAPGASEEGGPQELMVSNLDYNISAREWKKILFTEFQQQVQVLGVNIQMQADNTSLAFVRVPCIEDARYAISQFHRKKIGYKRIHVSLVDNSNGGDQASSVKSEVTGLLQEVAGNRLPLFKFIELYEKRYHRTISVSELYRMRSVIEIQEMDGTGRTVVLLTSPRNGSPKSVASDGSDKPPELLESPVCRRHCAEGSKPYVEAMDSCCLPSVMLCLKSFAPQVHTLLQSHEGAMPLMSFPACYSAEFGELKPCLEGGVPMEHLISCVPGVNVAVSKSGVKKVLWAENKPTLPIEWGKPCSSPLLSNQLNQFSREVVDLLRNYTGCRMPFSKFIPSYHHHFGRQCRVADYGYTKLMELFEALPHVVQILGSGSRRYTTLSHRSQVKRFTSDLLRVLKSQSSKQISVVDFPIIYNKVVGRAFEITDYGVCYLEDILAEVPENTIIVEGGGNDMVISLPRREQTLDEIERTKQLSLEVIDLLKNSPQCQMPFNKFIPAYHHHFGKQCRVSDFGFTKLMELFEAIPHVVEMVEEDGEKILRLTQPELLKVLEEHVQALLKTFPEHTLPVPEFLAAYMRHHGNSLNIRQYGVSNVVQLIEKIPSVARVEDVEGKLMLRLVDNSEIEQLARRVLLLLMGRTEGKMSVSDLQQSYEEKFGETLEIDQLAKLHNHGDYVEMTSQDKEPMVKLSVLQQFSRDTRTLLRAHQGRLALNMFEAAYAQYFGVSLVPASYGYPSVAALLQAVPHMATIRGKGYRRTVLLSQDFQDKVPLSKEEGMDTPAADMSFMSVLPSLFNPAAEGVIPGVYTPSDDSAALMESNDEELMRISMMRSRSPFDVFAATIPSAIPTPELQPSIYRQSPVNLIRFDPTPPPPAAEMLTMSEDERKGLKTPLCQTPVSQMLQLAAQFLPPTDNSEHPPLPTHAPSATPPPGTLAPATLPGPLAGPLPPCTLAGSSFTSTGFFQQHNIDGLIEGDQQTADQYPPPPDGTQFDVKYYGSGYKNNNAAFEGFNPATMLPDMPCYSGDPDFPTGRYYQHLDIEQQMQSLGMEDKRGLQVHSADMGGEHRHLQQASSSGPFLDVSPSKLGTPRRSRLAARFDVSLSPSSVGRRE